MTSSEGVRKTAILALRGDITKLDVEAIVNPANSYLTMGGGVAAAIRRGGGTEIEEEAMQLAPVPIGRAITTRAGRLPARHVIHAPTMTTPGPTTAEKVYLATLAALREAERIGTTSLAIPGMGTGAGRVSPPDAARSIVRAVREHLAAGSKLQRVVLVDIDREMVAQYEAILKE